MAHLLVRREQKSRTDTFFVAAIWRVSEVAQRVVLSIRKDCGLAALTASGALDAPMM